MILAITDAGSHPNLTVGVYNEFTHYNRIEIPSTPKATAKSLLPASLLALIFHFG
jgi:hypothetical protein